jgi:LEA14-like dessication related protein
VALVVAGCASLTRSRFIMPELSLNEVVVRNVGVLGGAVDLVLDVRNPNRYDLHGTAMNLALDVEGSHLGDVDLSRAFTLAGDSVTRLTVPMTFEWAGVGAAARAALNYGEVKYKLTGRSTMQTPFGMERIPITLEGTVPIETGVTPSARPPGR